jgi:zinc transport system substrate-binding protein
MRSSSPVALVVAAALALSACGGAQAETGSDRVSAVVGFYPYAFVTERVGGDDVDVTDLTAAGGEPHDLELTPRQVGAVGEADLVVYSAGFQPAVDEAVEQQAEDRALDVLSTVELRDGGEHGPEEEDREEEGHEGDEHASGDPHVWLDPVRLATIATAVADRLAEVDPDSAADYRSRADELGQELTALDDELRAGLSSCDRSQIVTSHDAFGYLADAYGLEQVAIAGLSPEDEASPRRLAEVAAQAEAAGVTTIFFEESVSPKVAESLAREVGATATVLSPLELAPESGDYLTAMRENLGRLRTALGCS